MPRGIPKIKEAESKVLEFSTTETQEVLETLRSVNKKIYPAIEDIKKRLDELSVRVLAIETKPVEAEVSPPSPQPAISSGGFPIPSEYREIVNIILNDKFGIKLDYFPTNFMFTVSVPDEYSQITPGEKSVIGGDLRSRIIPNAEGTNGVRKWIETVYNSFNPEIKAKIKLTS